MKAFDNSAAYDREIDQLAPGHQALHSLIPFLLAGLKTPPNRLLVIGCGSGQELVALAEALPSAAIVAIDPSAAMLAATHSRLARAGLERRVRTHQCSIAEFKDDAPFDGAVAVLVGHFIPDDGSRAAYYRHIANALVVGAPFVSVELERASNNALFTAAQVHRATFAGMPPPRAETLERRLSQDLYALAPSRLTTLTAGAGLVFETTFFQAFAYVGRLLTKQTPLV